MEYRQKLLDGRWQRRRLEILSRDGFQCRICGQSNNVQIHHNWYLKGHEPWEYADGQLVTLCESHHQEITEVQNSIKKLLSEAGPEFQKDFLEFLTSRKLEDLTRKIHKKWVLCRVIESERINPRMCVLIEVCMEDGSKLNVSSEFNIWSEDSEERDSARYRFSMLLRAVGVLSPKQSEEIHGLPFLGFFASNDFVSFKKA